MEHKFTILQPVLVRDGDQGTWRLNIFSHYNNGLIYPFVCLYGSYLQCIPAEGNEHLVGTTDSPQPETDFQFGDHVEVWGEDPEKCYSARYLAKHNDQIYSHRVFLEDDESISRFQNCRHAKGYDMAETTDNAIPQEPEFQFGDKVEVRNRDEADWTPAIYINKRTFIDKMLKYEVILQTSHRTTCWLQCRHADW